jgi:hypothetical protein
VLRGYDDNDDDSYPRKNGEGEGGIDMLFEIGAMQAGTDPTI